MNLGSYQPARPPLLLRVTAIVAPRRPGSPFWQADPVLAAPVIPVSSPAPAFLLGEALVGPDELPILQSAFGGGFIHGEWFTPLDLAALDRAKLTPVLNHLHGLTATDGGTALEAELPSFGGAGTSSTLTVSSGIPDGLSGFLAQQQAADAVDTLLIADVLLAGLLLIATCARLVASAYGPELTVIRARGGSARQVAGRVLARSACLAGLGAVVGAVLALAITPTPPGGSAISWALGGLAAAAAIVIPALAAFWSHRGIRPAGDERADLASARPSRRRLIAELTVLVLAAAALAAVRLRGIGAGDRPVHSARPGAGRRGCRADRGPAVPGTCPRAAARDRRAAGRRGLPGSGPRRPSPDRRAAARAHAGHQPDPGRLRGHDRGLGGGQPGRVGLAAGGRGPDRADSRD